ncbi:MAG: fused MFS/spermidine synthase [Nevskia sp.]|nr:fused MFS/spermidine synthase [Nevskia sp.]
MHEAPLPDAAQPQARPLRTGIVAVQAVHFGVTILAGAFLLFQIQPLIARLIMPWFGGSAAVWTTCMLFFQVTLLAGYAYAHWLARLAGTRQAAIHLALLTASLLCLPVLPSTWWKPAGPDDPMLRIAGLLAATVGLPYFLLASTSPLLQSWYSRTRRGAIPYRFFALSNAGSMAGLLSYPVLVEPNLSTREQAWSWSIAYAGFAVTCGAMAWRARGGSTVGQSLPAFAGPAPPARERLLWLALAACASALLLGVTAHLTQNVAAAPFLWVLPLALYLLSFILCFDGDRWYRRGVFLPLGVLALPAMACAIAFHVWWLHTIRATVALFGAATFVVFMVCHGELARRRPDAAHLTGFYLMVSAGGALGGVLIGLAAPQLFNALYDLPLLIGLIALLFCALLWLEQRRVFGAALAGALTLGLWGFLALDLWASFAHQRLLARNFYGALAVQDKETHTALGPVRILRHGVINHGAQFLLPQNRRLPTTYFGESSGVGLALRTVQKRGPMHVGVIGLGTGTLLAYARPQDSYRVYEINPLVLQIAHTQFSFLDDCPAPHQVVLGDARLSLEREPPQQFDLLVLDAFSGDAIPVHLLTREAFRLYWQHLKPDGVLAVHVSNSYLRLWPVVAQASAETGKTARLVHDIHDDKDRASSTSDWVLVTSSPGFFASEGLERAQEIETLPGLRTWTDDYSNLYRILR